MFSAGENDMATGSLEIAAERITKKELVVHLTSVHGAFDVRIFHRECKSLANHGYKVLLIAPHDRNEEVDGVKINALPRPRSRPDRMTRIAWLAYRAALRQSAAVYHLHDPELIGIGLLLRARGKKVIYDIHENLPKSILSKHYLAQGIRRPLAWLATQVERAACRRFSALVPAAPSIEERVKTLNPKVVSIQNFPVSKEMHPPTGVSWGERSQAIAYVGGISERRGIKEMVKAMSLLPDELNIRLKLAGPFIPERLREEVCRMEGWNRVDMLGVLERRAVMLLLSQVKAGLVLIHHPFTRFKPGSPIKMFEYMAMGIPVIASDCPQWREIIGGASCGLLVDPRKSQSIAEAIQYIISSPEQAEAMGRRGRQAVEELYNWEAERTKLLHLYTSLLEPTSDVCLNANETKKSSLTGERIRESSS